MKELNIQITPKGKYDRDHIYIGISPRHKVMWDYLTNREKNGKGEFKNGGYKQKELMEELIEQAYHSVLNYKEKNNGT